MRLYNRDRSAALEVTLRPFRPSDTEELIACIREAYGDTYVKPFLYTPEGVLHCEESGEMRFSVAEDDAGRIIGITAYECSEHFPGLAEIGCQVIRRAYNGYGLALPLALHSMERAEHLPLASQFARALGCHLISQKTLDSMGFTACGFLLNVFDKERFLFHAPNGNYAKIPQSVAVKRQRKRETGPIRVPEELLPLARAMYQALGLSWTLQAETAPPEGPGVWESSADSRHATLTLWAKEPGADFPQQLTQRVAAVAHLPGQTVNLYLNLSAPGSRAAYAAAREQGFFFTGFLPCAADGEYLILHHPLSVPVLLDEIPHIPEYAPFMAQIRRQLWKTK